MFGGTSGLILKYHSITIPSSTSSPIFISPPSQPLFRFHHHHPSTAPKSTSSTSASRHRRHRLTDVDDVDLEGVEQGEMKRCCYRNYVSPVTIISCPLKSILSYKILNRVNSPRIHYQIIRNLIRFRQHLLPNT